MLYFKSKEFYSHDDLTDFLNTNRFKREYIISITATEYTSAITRYTLFYCFKANA